MINIITQSFIVYALYCIMCAAFLVTIYSCIVPEILLHWSITVCCYIKLNICVYLYCPVQLNANMMFNCYIYCFSACLFQFYILYLALLHNICSGCTIGKNKKQHNINFKKPVKEVKE